MFGQLIRGNITNSQNRIMFEALPNVDRIWYLLKSILLARESSDLKLEIELFDQLIYIYRDPKLLIHLTREIESEKLNE